MIFCGIFAEYFKAALHLTTIIKRSKDEANEVQTLHDKMTDTAREHGLRIAYPETLGDGNCLFRAIAEHPGINCTHDTLRKSVQAYMVENADFIKVNLISLNLFCVE